MFVLEEISDPKRRRWLRRANIPGVYFGREVADLHPYAHDENVRTDVAQWMRSVQDGRIIKGKPRGLAFYGEPGQGKTVLALAIAQELIVRSNVGQLTKMWCPSNDAALGAVERPVWYGYYPEMLAVAKQAMSGDEDAIALENAIFGRSKNPDQHVRVLVLDDLGKEHRTKQQWAENYFDHLLRTRFYKGLTTLLTSNVDRVEWADAYGPAMDSFGDEAFYAIAIASRMRKDRRRE